jgi:hypothetical protein
MVVVVVLVEVVLVGGCRQAKRFKFVQIQREQPARLFSRLTLQHGLTVHSITRARGRHPRLQTAASGSAVPYPYRGGVLSYNPPSLLVGLKQ